MCEYKYQHHSNKKKYRWVTKTPSEQRSDLLFERAKEHLRDGEVADLPRHHGQPGPGPAQRASPRRAQERHIPDDNLVTIHRAPQQQQQQQVRFSFKGREKEHTYEKLFEDDDDQFFDL